MVQDCPSPEQSDLTGGVERPARLAAGYRLRKLLLVLLVGVSLINAVRLKPRQQYEFSTRAVASQLKRFSQAKAIIPAGAQICLLCQLDLPSFDDRSSWILPEERLKYFVDAEFSWYMAQRAMLPNFLTRTPGQAHWLIAELSPDCKKLPANWQLVKDLGDGLFVMKRK